MKKIYTRPEVQVNETEVSQMMAVSIQSGSADPDLGVLSKEDEGSWDIWEE